MALSRRDERTEQVLARSRDLQRRLQEMAAELDAFSLALQQEVERARDTREKGQPQ